jgi:hypothetical protein
MKGLMRPAQRHLVPYVDLRIEALTPEQIGELADAVTDLKVN